MHALVVMHVQLLERVFALLRERNPNLAERKRYVMPPPTLVRVGTRKTMWTNFAVIANMYVCSCHVCVCVCVYVRMCRCIVST